MKLVIQKVSNAKVEVEKNVVGEIEKVFWYYLVQEKETQKSKQIFLQKNYVILCNLRVFNDENKKMNLSIKDINGELLIVSQFTLYADCKKGNRPSFVKAEEPKIANELYEYFINECKKYVKKVENGIFGANMQVSLLNDGPVTIILEK